MIENEEKFIGYRFSRALMTFEEAKILAEKKYMGIHLTDVGTIYG